MSGGEYGDFETIFEVKPDWGIDSGYFLRSTEDGRAYQVLVDYHGGGGNVGGIYGEGIGGFNARNYNLKPDKSIAAVEGRSDAHPLPFRAEEWTRHWRLEDYNEVRARIAGNPPAVDVWLNGVHLTHFEDREKRLEAKGRLGLQVHGGKGWPAGAKVRFRNVQVRELGN